MSCRLVAQNSNVYLLIRGEVGWMTRVKDVEERR